MTNDYVDETFQIDPKFEENYRPLNDVYLDSDWIEFILLLIYFIFLTI